MAAVAQMQTCPASPPSSRSCWTHVHDDHTRRWSSHQGPQTSGLPIWSLPAAGARPARCGTHHHHRPGLVGWRWRGLEPDHRRGGSGSSTPWSHRRGPDRRTPRASAHQDLDAAYTAWATGARRSASCRWRTARVSCMRMGNEFAHSATRCSPTSGARDITGLRDGIRAPFADAMRNVRVVGARPPPEQRRAHAGRHCTWNLLLEQTLQRNGSTLPIQSREGFAFDGPVHPHGLGGRCSTTSQRQGVVVFAGAPTGTNSTDTATLDKPRPQRPGAGAGGTGIQVFKRRSCFQAAHRRLQPAARSPARTVGESLEFAAQAPEQPGQTSAQLQTALQADITRIETCWPGASKGGGRRPTGCRHAQPGGRDHTAANSGSHPRSRINKWTERRHPGPTWEPTSLKRTLRFRRRLQIWPLDWAAGHQPAYRLRHAGFRHRRRSPAARPGPPLGRQYRELADLTRRWNPPG